MIQELNDLELENVVGGVSTASFPDDGHLYNILCMKTGVPAISLKGVKGTSRKNYEVKIKEGDGYQCKVQQVK